MSEPISPVDRDSSVEARKKDIDRSLLRANLRRTVEERLANLLQPQALAEEARRAGSANGPMPELEAQVEERSRSDATGPDSP